jgi:hypothetical protein
MCFKIEVRAGQSPRAELGGPGGFGQPRLGQPAQLTLKHRLGQAVRIGEVGVDQRATGPHQVADLLHRDRQAPASITSWSATSRICAMRAGALLRLRRSSWSVHDGDVGAAARFVKRPSSPSEAGPYQNHKTRLTIGLRVNFLTPRRAYRLFDSKAALRAQQGQGRISWSDLRGRGCAPVQPYLRSRHFLALALAQTATPTSDAVVHVEEIIVTATRREQALSDVPMAISAVGAQTLRNSGATDVRALSQLNPSLLVSSTGSESNTSARIGASARSATTPAWKARSPSSSTASTARAPAWA